jgi:hypothetical protein
MASDSQKTGTSDQTYNLVSILYHCLQGIETCEKYLADLQGDQELRGFVEKFQQCNRDCAEEGKRLLAQCLEREGGNVPIGKKAF